MGKIFFGEHETKWGGGWSGAPRVVVVVVVVVVVPSGNSRPSVILTSPNKMLHN